MLADRLKRLLAAGLLTRADDPGHRQKTIYSLTEPAIQLVLLLAQLGAFLPKLDSMLLAATHIRLAGFPQT